MKTIIKKYYLLIILTALYYQTLGIEKNKTNDLNDCTNYVLIQGSSNINKFEFINYSPSVSFKPDKGNIKYPDQNIKIPVNKFSGTNNMMLNDFHKMLNAPKYPYINIVIEPREKADFDETTGLTNFKTQISIAGNTHNYVIPCQIDFCKNSDVIVKGDVKLELSDFNIDPPRKVFGAVKVSDEVFITFAFHYL